MRPFPDKKYDIILADPPWSYRDKASAGKRGAEFKYPVMKPTAIAALPVWNIAKTNALLFLWVTMPQLETVFRSHLFQYWGFQFKTCAFTWVKRNKVAPSWFWGMGNWTRSNAELCLLGVRGKPKRASAKVHSIINTRIEAHSKKPDIVREKIVELCGDLPRIELFARERVPGWDCWGNEV